MDSIRAEVMAYLSDPTSEVKKAQIKTKSSREITHLRLSSDMINKRRVKLSQFLEIPYIAKWLSTQPKTDKVHFINYNGCRTATYASSIQEANYYYLLEFVKDSMYNLFVNLPFDAKTTIEVINGLFALNDYDDAQNKIKIEKFETILQLMEAEEPKLVSEKQDELKESSTAELVIAPNLVSDNPVIISTVEPLAISPEIPVVISPEIPVVISPEIPVVISPEVVKLQDENTKLKKSVELLLDGCVKLFKECGREITIEMINKV